MNVRSPHTDEGVHTPPPLHELEAEVMEEVWHRGEASVREIMMALNVAAPRERAYTTYMTQTWFQDHSAAKGIAAPALTKRSGLWGPSIARPPGRASSRSVLTGATWRSFCPQSAS